MYFNNEGSKEVGGWKVAKRNTQVEENYLKRKFPRLSHPKLVTEIKKYPVPALILYILTLEQETTEQEENPLKGVLVSAYEVFFPSEYIKYEGKKGEETVDRYLNITAAKQEKEDN
ncbi:hypothetical protein [Helicobacter suis]|uniref:hypothetical protein n=1 Tax=Helicobacter suis TaxID=104628 RepID=UPI0013D8B491|nr:hypothetical protein [Helicobacter suis]